MSRSRLLASILVLLAGTTAPASAGVMCHSTSLDTAQVTDWSESVALPRFDPNLGQLTAVTCTITGCVAGSMATENPGPSPTTATLVFQAEVSLQRPVGTALVIAIPSITFIDSLSAYDGTLDLGGTSGAWHFGIDVLATSSASTAQSGDLALFTGAPGDPGFVTLPVRAVGTSSFTGGGALIFLVEQWASAPLIQVCYEFDSPGVVTCSGDGTGTACPCGNFGAQAHGCASSANPDGALLGASGSASLANDTVVLACGGMPARSTCLYIQGTTSPSFGQGEVFGDGLRCASGTVMRLGSKTNVAGASRYPEAGDASVSMSGGVLGGTRYYQVWYRNAGAFCTSSTFNLSNALAIGWGQ